MAVYTMTEISATTSGPIESVAPNGSSRSVDYYTTVTLIQDWHEIPENGIYAGLSYMIIKNYISHTPDFPRRQLIDSSSSPYRG
jgi:hypothetical protein